MKVVCRIRKSLMMAMVFVANLTAVAQTCNESPILEDCGIHCQKIEGLHYNCCTGGGASPCCQYECWTMTCFPYVPEGPDCYLAGASERVFVRDYTWDWVCSGTNCYYEP